MEVCPQCCNTLNTANCRLVQDACGHKKCRLCLVLEENGCVACSKTGKPNKNVEDLSVSASNFSDSSYQIPDDNEIKFELFNGLVKSDIGKSSKAAKCETSEEVVGNIKYANEAQNDGDKNSKAERKEQKKKPIEIGSHITVIPGNPVRYHCTACNKSFGAKYSVKYHNFCAAEKKPFQCILCKKGFVTKSHYDYHLRVHSGSQPFVCDSCGKGFSQKGKLTQHIKCHTGTKSYMCEECGKSFALKRSLDMHLFIHSRERNHVCEKCNRGFAMKKDLKRHMIVHSNDRPHSCSVCGMKFRRKDNLERHVKNTHLETPAPEEQQQRQSVPSESITSKSVEPNNSMNTIETSDVDRNTIVDTKVISKSSNPSPLKNSQQDTSCVKMTPMKEKGDNSVNNVMQPVSVGDDVAESTVGSKSTGNITKYSEAQPKEYYRAVPVINRPVNFAPPTPITETVIPKSNICENPEAAKEERPLFEGKNCVRTITRASSSGKTMPQQASTVIKPKLECFRILERPETFKPVEPPKISQPSLRMLLNDVECSDNTGTVLDLTQDVQASRTDSLFQDSLGILENSKYDKGVSKSYGDTNLPDMYPSDFLLPSCDINRTSYNKRLYYAEDISSQYRMGSVSYDQFMGSPYLVADVGSNPNNPGPCFRTEDDVSGRLKLLADVAGTKDPSVHISQVIVGTKKAY
ncbi:uncharacterized protein [Anabrus simplex]|uniref:uncharacterized protein isoform X2 n=1 Tax=Anabrus simplex TaxID=316456 RepID=UPI0035A2705A